MSNFGNMYGKLKISDKKVSVLNVEEMVDIEKIIKLRSRCISKIDNTKTL